MNFAKQWIEYSPLGIATLPGAGNKREQLAKALLGSTIAAVGAKFALDGNTTWDVPTDPKEKELFYAAGRKPFSIKMGDKWVPMMYAGPFALALALPAAMKYYQSESRTSLTDSQLDKASKAIGSMTKFLAGQTFLEGLNNFVRLASGDIDYSLPGNIAYTAGQVIPLEGMVRYINTIVDPIYRKGASIQENIMKNLPGLSSQLPAYTTPTGEPSRREPINYVLPYDVGVSQQQYEPALKLRNTKLQFNAVGNMTDNQIYDQLKSGNEADFNNTKPILAAESVYRYINSFKDKNEQNATFLKIKDKLPPEVKEKLKNVIAADKAGMTATERGYFQMSSELRAEEIYNNIMKLAPKNRAKKVQQLKQWGAITPEVAVIIKDLANKGGQ
jgi:hypothetical protein